MAPLLKDPERQKMYEHIVAMFIVTWMLIIGLFVVGCKEKAEAEETTICDYCPHIGWFGKPNSCDKFREALEEPNDPRDSIHIFMTGDDGEVFNKTYLGTESEIRKALIKDGVISEPNEPTIIYHFAPGYYYPNEPNGPMKYSLPIPTWPDYIELERDLVIDISNRERKPANKMWTFVKGTRIYFKEDD